MDEYLYLSKMGYDNNDENKSISKLQTTTTVTKIESRQDQDGATSMVKRFKDSFKKSELYPIDGDVDYEGLSEKDNIQQKLASQPYKKVLSQRHLTMIAIGGTLGTGLFIGLGYSLACGPGSLLIGFLLVGTSIFCVVQSAAELSCQFPVSGSYATHVSRFIDQSIGFTVATNYALSWLISFPSELIGCSLTISYWDTNTNPAVWVAIFYIFIMTLNLFGARGFAEVEFILSIIKILAIIIFIVIGIVLIAGGGPDSKGYIGTKYWHDPGSFNKPVFKNLCNTFVSAAFSFGGSELVLLTSTESKSVSAISRAAKGTFWRVAIFYITTVVIIGCLVPYTDNRLLNGSSDEDITASPFVIALSNTGIMGKKVSNFMNVVILIAVLSVCNSCVYAASRVIQALGASGQLPKICGYIDRRGRPLIGIAICGIFGLLGFLVASREQSNVFTWLFALCSISSFFTWFCICCSQIRFRMALKHQGRSTDEIAYKSMLGVYGGVLGCVLNVLLIAGEIYVSAFPVGEKSSAEGFFEYCLSIPIMIFVYVLHRIYRRDWRHWYIKIKDINIDTGCSVENLELFKEQRSEDKKRIANKPFYYRIYRFLC